MTRTPLSLSLGKMADPTTWEDRFFCKGMDKD